MSRFNVSHVLKLFTWDFIPVHMFVNLKKVFTVKYFNT